MIGRSTRSVLGTKKVTEINTSRIVVRPILDEADAKLMYQAYRLNLLPGGWKAQQNMEPKDFIETLDGFIRRNYDLNWSVREDGQPLIVVFAKDANKFLIMGDVVWWSKVTDRQRVEAAAAIFNEIRKDRVAFIEAEYQHKKFYELLVNRKILRRVGSIYDTLHKDSRTTFFQTRAT